MRVAPSGRFPSLLEIPIGSLTQGISALCKALAMISFTSLCVALLPALFLQARPCNPSSDTIEPQMQMCFSHILHPNLKAHAMWKILLFSRVPKCEDGTHFSHALASGLAVANNLALSSSESALSSSVLYFAAF